MDISSDLHFESSPKVDVLLATYNGSLFLAEQLESLAQQNHVRINLLVGDDGSLDNTKEIVAKYGHRFEGIQIYDFPHLGPACVFLQLLKYSNSSFFAFCDQDDVWREDKLQKSLLAMSRHGNLYPVIISSLLEISNNRSFTPRCYPYPSSIFWNGIPGCSILGNSCLRKILCQLDPGQIIMHDWAASVICSLIGEIEIIQENLTMYRIHQNNFVGLPSVTSKLGKVLKSLLCKHNFFPTIQQYRNVAATILSFCEHETSFRYVTQRMGGECLINGHIDRNLYSSILQSDIGLAKKLVTILRLWRLKI